MSTEADARALMQRYWDAFVAADLEAWGDCYTEDAVYEDVPTGFVGTPREFYEDFLKTFPEVTPEMNEEIITAEGYGLAWTIRGTLTEDFGEIKATGQPWEVKGSSIGRIRDGRIAMNRDYWDLAGLLRQLGATELPTE
jgi:steroid delta-isomerase-like uncharacterized protein